MTVLIDLDNTCNDFTGLFIKWVEKLGYEFDYDKYDSWDIEDAIVADNPRKVLAEILDNLKFWDELTPLPGCVEAMRKINSKYTVKIVTIPWKPESAFQNQKKKWVRKYFPFISNNQISFESKKWLVDGDVIIDDKPAILKKSADLKLTIKHIQPYNEDTDTDYEFSNWSEVPSILRKAEKDLA